MHSKPHVKLAAALLVSALAFGQPALAEESTVSIALPSDVPSLDPTRDTSPIGQNIRLNIFDQLTTIGREGEVLPRLATSWEPSEDSVTWTFTLREDATFHDGVPVTADDVIWTYQTILDDDTSPVRSYLSKIESMEKVSDHELRIVLEEPFAPFDRWVALVSIAPKHAYETLGASEFGNAPIGSGPYKLVQWSRDDRIVMEANQDYWGGMPSVERMMFRPIPADSSRASALLSGEVDIVPMLPPQLAEGMVGRDDIDLVEVESHRVLYLGFDVTQEPLDNVEVRRAIDMAVDRQAISDQLLRGLGVPIGQIVAPVSFGYDPEIEATDYDPDQARELLEQSGYDGQEIVLQYPNNNVASNDAVAQAIAGFMTEIGLNVRLDGMEYTAFFPLWTGRQLNSMHMFTYGPTNLDADLPLTSLYETGRSRGYWENPETDEMVRAQRAEADPERRQAIISDIWRLTKDQVIYSLIYNEKNVWGLSNRVAMEPRADGIVRLSEIELTDN